MTRIARRGLIRGFLGSVLACSGPPPQLTPGTPADATAPPSMSAAPALPDDPERAGLQASGGAFPANFCERPGRDPGVVYQTLVFTAGDYESRRSNDCLTAGLLDTSRYADFIRWQDYLTQYTAAMAGCPLIAGPLEGGILVFGPANTAAIGIRRAAVGRDDVSTLIGHYVGAFTAGLSLSTGESDALSAYLWETAESEIDPGTSSGLSRCAADAGVSDSGAPNPGDAGPS
jgi:hypothetical protein